MILMASRKDELKNSVRTTIYLEENQIDTIKNAAIKLSVSEGRIVTHSEAIRRAIDICYPSMKKKKSNLLKSKIMKKK